MTDDELTELAKELFKIFARFEYALKEAGFHTGEGDASPHWRNFALSVDESLEEQAIPELASNLFHGGKFNGHWFDPDRSENLMKSSLVILNAALAASDPVRQAYG
jgi:hypothetical protein